MPDIGHGGSALTVLWHRLRPRIPFTRSTSQTPTSTTAVELDIRPILPHATHPTIFRTFDALANGQSLVVIVDHDPAPLGSQLMADPARAFWWTYRERGPVVWCVQIEHK